MKKSILFITATHGDERIGVEAVKKITDSNAFDTVIGNPRAFAQNTRFTDTDLNRTAPGNLQSNRYEEQRAGEILALSKKYQYTIDLHGTRQNTGVFLLITSPTTANLRLASFFDIKNLVVWPSVTPEMQYPMSEFFPCGLEIESGPQDDQRTIGQLTATLTDFLDNLSVRETLSETAWQTRLLKKNLYEMYGSIPVDTGLDATQLQELQLTTFQGETFAPIFIGTYGYQNILGYKLQKYTAAEFSQRFLN